MSQATMWTALISGASVLGGVALGAWLTHWRESSHRKKRYIAYGSALSAEVDLCNGLSKAYLHDNVASPLYRLPTIAYTGGWRLLLLDYAHAAVESGNMEMLDREVKRLHLKAKNLHATEYKDEGGPYYLGVRPIIDRHVRRARQGTVWPIRPSSPISTDIRSARFPSV
jgi:hypothetical protein